MMCVPFKGNINLTPGRAGVKVLGLGQHLLRWHGKQGWMGGWGLGGTTLWYQAQEDFLKSLLHLSSPSCSSRGTAP